MNPKALLTGSGTPRFCRQGTCISHRLSSTHRHHVISSSSSGICNYRQSIHATSAWKLICLQCFATCDSIWLYIFHTSICLYVCTVLGSFQL